VTPADVERARLAVEQAEQTLSDTIAQALYWDASWADLARALGVARQSAWRRWRHVDTLGRWFLRGPSQ
jgi:hypothetical protein